MFCIKINVCLFVWKCVIGCGFVRENKMEIFGLKWRFQNEALVKCFFCRFFIWSQHVLKSWEWRLSEIRSIFQKKTMKKMNFISNSIYNALVRINLFKIRRWKESYTHYLVIIYDWNRELIENYKKFSYCMGKTFHSVNWRVRVDREATLAPELPCQTD